jgi:hypothetical protein
LQPKRASDQELAMKIDLVAYREAK